MAYTLNKIRNRKCGGRGYSSKNKSGSRGGTGRAGHNTHKNLPPVIYKKKSRYIKYNVLIKNKQYFVNKGVIVKIDGIQTILVNKLNKKIIQLPKSSRLQVRGKFTR